MAYKVNPEKCVACHACIGACPVMAIAAGADDKAVIDPAQCISCGTCAGICPVGAIAMDVAAAQTAPTQAPVVQMTPSSDDADDAEIKTAA